jgi:hypothetical protein
MALRQPANHRRFPPAQAAADRRNKPASVFSSVDFPQPFRPTMAVMLPAAIVPLRAA